MPQHFSQPARIPAAGNKPKRIDEYLGRVATGTAHLSIARMQSPEGWVEPAQQPEFEEQAGAVVVRFLPSGYLPPLRVSHDLTDRQRRILQILADGRKRRLQEIHGSLESPPAKRTLLDDLKLLRQVGLVDSGGRGVGAKWWLVKPKDVE